MNSSRTKKLLKPQVYFIFLFGGPYNEKGFNSLIEDKKSLWSWSCHSVLEFMFNKPELEFRP